MRAFWDAKCAPANMRVYATEGVRASTPRRPQLLHQIRNVLACGPHLAVSLAWYSQTSKY